MLITKTLLLYSNDGRSQYILLLLGTGQEGPMVGGALLARQQADMFRCLGKQRHDGPRGAVGSNFLLTSGSILRSTCFDLTKIAFQTAPAAQDN